MSTHIIVAFARNRITWQGYLMIGYFSYLLNALGPATPFLRAELNLSYTVASFHFSAYAVGVIITGLGLHKITARFGVRPLVWAGAVGMSVGSLLLMLGTHPAVTIAGTFLMGLMGTFLVALLNTVLAYMHRQFSAVALTESAMFATMISAMAPLAVGFFARTELSWRGGIGVMLLALPLLWLVYGRSPLRAGPGDGPSSTTAEADGKPGRLPLIYWAYWLLILLAVAIEFCILFWAADYLEKVIGLPRADAAAAVSAFLVAMLAGRAAASRLLAHHPASRMLLISLLVAGAGFMLFWLSNAAIPALAGLMVAGLGVAGVFPIGNALALATVPRRMVEGSARLSLAVGLAVLLLPLLLGRLADLAGIRPAYAVVAVLILLALVLTQLTATKSKDWLARAET
jgi:MFS family permease